MAMDANMKKMIGYAVGATGLAIVDLTGIAVINGYKSNGSVDNTTADLFVSGLVVFGTFLAIIVLALVGKIIMGLFTKEGY